MNYSILDHEFLFDQSINELHYLYIFPHKEILILKVILIIQFVTNMIVEVESMNVHVYQYFVELKSLQKYFPFGKLCLKKSCCCNRFYSGQIKNNQDQQLNSSISNIKKDKHI